MSDAYRFKASPTRNPFKARSEINLLHRRAIALHAFETLKAMEGMMTFDLWVLMTSAQVELDSGVVAIGVAPTPLGEPEIMVSLQPLGHQLAQVHLDLAASHQADLNQRAQDGHGCDILVPVRPAGEINNHVYPTPAVFSLPSCSW